MPDKREVTGLCFDTGVSPTRLQLAADRRTRRLRGAVVADLRRLREDAGIPVRALATAAGLSHTYTARVPTGTERPTLEAYERLAAVLGSDLSVRVYPNTGPAIHDRHQAPILECLLRERHPRWRPFTEIAVQRPSRGWIDAGLHEPREHVLVATEIQGALPRLEQLIRWSAAKAESLPSWDGWGRLGDEPTISRLLVVRRTRAT
jgi:transcriptional regulator with XRE-family HTH domain